MQKSKTGKFSIFSPLDAKLGSLAGRVGLTQFPVGSSRVGLEICSIRLESSWKCGQSDSSTVRVQNVNPKLDSTISLVLWNFLNDFCQVYLDDILIYSKMRKKHRDHVKLVLSRLREAELQMNIRKCKFNVEETVFLEVIVSELDFRMNFSKVTVIVSWITSINLKEIQSFVRFVNFYRCFIKNFLNLVKLFTQLTRKNTSFVWNEICVQVFDNLKKQVSLISVLRHFDLKRQAILKINALNYVKGEILSQYNDKKVLHSIIFYSKSMILAEINYHIYDKKLLVIIRCFEHWWFELKCIELLIQMFINHQALKIFMKNKQLSWQQVNYLNILSKFNFQKAITSFAQSYVISFKNVTMFSVIEKMMTSQSKKWFESCYETLIDCMIYSVLLFWTETLSSYQLCEKVFASDWESQLVYSQSIILRSMINRNKSIKTLNANLESIAITCRTTESNEYLWWNSATISISSRSLQWFSFTSIKNFTLEWVLIQIQLIMKQLVNDLKLEKQIILSFKWKSYWTSIINNWKRRSWSSKFR